jgi:5-bromo-4-chloroindolyl phosphate hydrolysis protein
MQNLSIVTDTRIRIKHLEKVAAGRRETLAEQKKAERKNSSVYELSAHDERILTEDLKAVEKELKQLKEKLLTLEAQRIIEEPVGIIQRIKRSVKNV